MIALIVLVLGGFFYVAETPVCRNDASLYVDARCAELVRESRRD